jgi:GT2 family glycosyltransferase
MEEEIIALSVVIVNWNVKDYLLECLRSVVQSTATIRSELIVVDNASTDGSADAVQQHFSHVRVVRNQENVGLARANNQGAKISRGRYVVFLNPDTKVLDDALPKMVETLNENPRIGGLGCKLLTAEMHWSREMGFRVPTVRTVTNEFLGLSRLLPIPSLFPGIVLSRDFRGLVDTDWVCGACFMVRREVLDQELWNEEIFLYTEDIEFSDRIRMRGWRICCTADARVIHYSGKSTFQQSADFLTGKTSAFTTYLRDRQGPLAAWIGIGAIRLGLWLRGFYHSAAYRVHGDVASLEKSKKLKQYQHFHTTDKR